MLLGFKICKKHLDKINKQLETAPVEKEDNWDASGFVPPIPDEPMPNYQDREPGSDDE